MPGPYAIGSDSWPGLTRSSTIVSVRHVLLAGIVGSTAYGLAGPHSDVDRLGVFAVSTVELHGLQPPPESYVSSNPDVTLHEARKYCLLALGGNPTATELMWLPPDLYETTTPLGEELIARREAFLSAKRTRDAYLGYAAQQFRRLEAKGVDRRTAKHARHLYRLCVQGFELYSTGHMIIRLDDPDKFRRFGEDVAGGDIEKAKNMLANYERLFEETKTRLPEEPDSRVVEDWLLKVRRSF
jgi:predicted nucleotidyltransferase